MPVEGAPTGDTSDARTLPRAFWPSEVTTEQAVGPVCAQLDAVAERDPGVHLARVEPGSVASADDVAVGQTDSDVDSGAGAFVHSGGWSAAGASALALIDESGFWYPVRGELEQENLGYRDVDTEVVPNAWVEMFDEGVVLSVDAARCPPTSRGRAEPCAVR